MLKSSDGPWRGEEDDHVLKFYLPCSTDVFFTAWQILARVTLPSNGGDPSSSQCQHWVHGWGTGGGDKKTTRTGGAKTLTDRCSHPGNEKQNGTEYRVGQKVHLGFSMPSYGNTQTHSLANPVSKTALTCRKSPICLSGPCCFTSHHLSTRALPTAKNAHPVLCQHLNCGNSPTAQGLF